ncbi:MAG: DNA-directed RNA polymerase subunit K [archaeon]
MEKYTKYEKARMIGARALQLSMGAPFALKFSKKDLEDMKYNPVRLATKEFDADAIAMEIRRPMPSSIRKKTDKGSMEMNPQNEEFPDTE